ncbi:trehalose-phosphatase [Patescibacteria group bacterium]|nr:trehalose-phosphatase [Patescibacteria group bacterium]
MTHAAARTEEADNSRAALVVALDFDGTLAPIARSSRQATIGAAPRAVLRRLVSLTAVRLAVISGRSLNDIRTKVGVSGITYAGNHGLEWSLDGITANAPVPAGESRAVRSCTRTLKPFESRFPGCTVEDKGMTVALHYRGVRPRMRSRLLRALSGTLRDPRLASRIRIIRGKMVFDVRPAFPWTKADFIRLLLRHERLPAATGRLIYIGDDATDEDVFSAFPSAMTVRVGRGKRTFARYRIRSPKTVTAFLSLLVARYETQKPAVAHRYA